MIRGGTVVDGTGTPARRADVAVADGRVVAIGDCEGEARRVLDATGLLVTPGFVDIHTHYDGQVSWDADLAPSVFHGVTTVVMGNGGVGFAPVRAVDRERLIDLMQGVEDIPGTALSEGIDWRWESFPEYMDAIDFPHSIDFAVQVPHDPLRVYVMGDRALASVEATAEEIAEMARLAREAVSKGAVGFSTGRTDNHRAGDGSHTPAAEATNAELAGIARALGELGRGVLQAVSDFDMTEDPCRFDAEFDVLEEMAVDGRGRPMSISLLQRLRDSEQWRRIVARADAAREKGVEICLQAAPRGIGVMLGLEATFHPFIGFPSYKKLAHLPLPARVSALSDPAVKAQMLTEESEKLAGDGSQVPPLADMLLANLEYVASRLWRTCNGFDYEPSLDDSLAAEAKRRGKPTLDHLYDVLLEDRRSPAAARPARSGSHRRASTRHPRCVRASSAGARRTDAAPDCLRASVHSGCQHGSDRARATRADVVTTARRRRRGTHGYGRRTHLCRRRHVQGTG